MQNEIIVGIIDYFRCYDIIKKLGRNGELLMIVENSVKSVGMIIGEKEPTVIPPNLYKKRFRLSMDSYFITVVIMKMCNVQIPDRYFFLKSINSEEQFIHCLFFFCHTIL